MEPLNQTTPAHILEKIIAYEAVHQIKTGPNCAAGWSPPTAIATAFSSVDGRRAVDVCRGRFDRSNSARDQPNTAARSRQRGADQPILRDLLFDIQLPPRLARGFVWQFSDQAGGYQPAAAFSAAENLCYHFTNPQISQLAKVSDKETETVIIGLIKRARKLPNELYQSLTWDRGKELADHQRFTLETNVDVCFCYPSSPWQRGSY